MSEEFDEFEELDVGTDEIQEELDTKAPISDTKINVFFQSTVGPSQRQEKMSITMQAPVIDLKYTVGQIFGLPAEEFHLSHAGRTMDPDDIVGNYNIEDNDTILLIPVSIAG